MQLKPGDFCPLLKKDCIGIKCSWFTQVRGTNPNTGQEIDEWKNERQLAEIIVKICKV